MTTQTYASASIYVGDLASDVTEGLLFEIFKRVGTVSSIKVCRDSVTKRSLGYAYVNFVNAADAQRSIDTLNNTPIKGRNCRIMWSVRDPSVRRSGVGNIFIRNLDTEIGPKELHDTFSQFGNIISCKVATYPNGPSKGYGYVHFENAANAEQAIKIVNGKRIGSSTVQVTHFISRQDRLKRIEETWTNVYIKNLDQSIDDEMLESIFSKFGPITKCVVMKYNDNDPRAGQSKEFGFVNFQNHSDAVAAVDQMHNQIYMGKELFCCRAQKKAERSAELKRQYEIKRRERINKYQGLNVYVKYLEDHITEEKLRKEFEPFGHIENVKIMTNEKGQSKGFGFVCFSTQEEANRAIAEIGRNTVLPGCTKPLYVAIHQPREQRQQRFTGRNRNNKGISNMPQPGGMFAQTGPVYYTGGMYPRMVPPGTAWAPQGQYPPNPINPNSYVMPQVQNPSGGGRNNNKTRNQPNQGTAPRAVKKEESEVVDRHKIGERIYEAITAKENQELARRITGMLIYDPKWSNADLYSFVDEEDKLDDVVREAKIFLESQQQPGNAGDDQNN